MAAAQLADVLIDDVTWSCATRPRRAEWRQAIDELLEEAVFEAGPAVPLLGYLTVHREGIAIALHGPTGHVAGQMELPQPLIAPVLREYMGIVSEMIGNRRGIASAQLEALDIAKRLTHDDAAELLMQHFRDVRPDHNTARRLFTLLVILTYDTTRLERGERVV